MAWMMARAKSAPGSRLGSDARWPHTLRRRVLAKVLGLVFAENAGGLDLGSSATGKLLVEVDDTLHADSVRGSTNGLRPPVSQLLFPWLYFFSQAQLSAVLSKQPGSPVLQQCTSDPQVSLMPGPCSSRGGSGGAIRAQTRTLGEAT